MSGEPTAGLVPDVPVPALPDPDPPDPATPGGTCRFGDGLAIGPELEGAAEVALAQALAPLAGAAPDLLCVFVAAGVPARSGLVEAAARHVMTTCGARTTIGATAAGVCGDGRAVDRGPAVAVWAASLPGARLRPFRPDARPEDGLPALDGDERAAVLLVDPYTFPLAGFLPHTGALPVVGGLASARGGPGSNRLFLDGEVHAHGAVGLLVGGDVAVATAVSQGCRPTGPPMTVTRAERNVVYELAGAPALVRLAEVVSAQPIASWRATARGLQLGVVVDEYVDEHPRDDFLVRGILDADEATGALVVGDVVEVGRTVRFQLRDAGTAAEDLALLLNPAGVAAGRRSPAAALQVVSDVGEPGGCLETAVGRSPASQPQAASGVGEPGGCLRGPRGALLFSCAERRALLGSPDRDVRAARDRLGGAAVAGLVVAGGIGPIGGRNHVHGHSAAVLTFG